jgi:hypothetical protein
MYYYLSAPVLIRPISVQSKTRQYFVSLEPDVFLYSGKIYTQFLTKFIFKIIMTLYKYLVLFLKRYFYLIGHSWGRLHEKSHF